MKHRTRLIFKNCEVCGERFPSSIGSREQYCSGCRRVIQQIRNSSETRKLRMHKVERICTVCGETFEAVGGQKICDSCKGRKKETKSANQKRTMPETNQQRIARLAYEAKQAGTSYGKYVAGMKEGQHE